LDKTAGAGIPGWQRNNAEAVVGVQSAAVHTGVGFGAYGNGTCVLFGEMGERRRMQFHSSFDVQWAYASSGLT